MSKKFDKLPEEFVKQLQNMIAANKSANQIREFIYSSMSSEQARNMGFSRSELYEHVMTIKKMRGSTGDGEKDPTSGEANPTAPQDGTGTVPSAVVVDADRSEDLSSESSESSDDTEASPGLDLEFASINVPELQGMILKKESFNRLAPFSCLAFFRVNVSNPKV